jgi:hypothetical protein
LRGKGCRNFAVEVVPESALILFLSNDKVNNV